MMSVFVRKPGKFFRILMWVELGDDNWFVLDEDGHGSVQRSSDDLSGWTPSLCLFDVFDEDMR